MSIKNKHTVRYCEPISYKTIIKFIKFQDFSPNYIENKLKNNVKENFYDRVCITQFFITQRNKK